MLVFPDFTKSFIMETGESDLQFGGVLMHKHGIIDFDIRIINRTLNLIRDNSFRIRRLDLAEQALCLGVPYSAPILLFNSALDT